MRFVKVASSALLIAILGLFSINQANSFPSGGVGNNGTPAPTPVPTPSPTPSPTQSSTPEKIVETKNFNIYFGLNTYFLDAKSRVVLKAAYNSVKSKITANSIVVVEVDGWVQPNRINPNAKWLSKNRAKAVAQYLKDLGLKGRYVIKASGKDVDNNASSRRATVKITVSN